MKGGWKGVSLQTANRIFSIINVEISKNIEEGCIIAKHPNTQELIRRSTVTGCIEAVMKAWVILK